MAENLYPWAEPTHAGNVTVVDKFKDTICYACTLAATSSKTIAELLSTVVNPTTVPVQACGVRIISNGTVRYNPIAAATTDNGLIPTDFTISGSKAILDLCEFYAAAEVVITIIVFEYND